MKRISIVFSIFLFLGLFLASSLAQKGKRDEEKVLVVLETSDVHGALFPYDFVKDTKVNRGYLAVQPIIQNFRSQFGDDHILYVDCGDLLQGDPLAEYFNFRDTTTIHPLIQILNDLNCDAFVVGNHDIEQGKKVWQRTRKFSRFPWLAANVVSAGNPDSLWFQPYTIIRKGDVKIGIIGLITPAIPNWLPESLWEGMYFEDMVETVKKYLWLRDSVDILIGAFHSGVDPQKGKPGYPSGLPEENASQIIASLFPQFDLILTGHQHKVIPQKDTLLGPEQPAILMPGKKAYQIGYAKLFYKKIDGKVQLTGKQLGNIRVNQDKMDTHLLRKYHRLQEQVISYVKESIGQITDTLEARWSRRMDTPFGDFIHSVQMVYSGAKLSIAAIFDTAVVVLPGKIQRNNVFAIYPYENTLYKIRIKGKYLEDLLERSARYYACQNGTLTISRLLPGYNFDMIEGLVYEIRYREGEDPDAIIYTLTDGTPFNPEVEYEVAVNSYRAQQLELLYGAKVVWKSEKSMREMIEMYIQQFSPITPVTNHNWKLIMEHGK